MYEAGDGIEAERVWDTIPQPVDLLLTDMVMPHAISGVELGARLRGRSPALKVLIMSVYSVERFHSGSAVPAGMHFLSKPFTSKTLSAAVEQALGDDQQVSSS